MVRAIAIALASKPMLPDECAIFVSRTRPIASSDTSTAATPLTLLARALAVSGAASGVAAIAAFAFGLGHPALGGAVATMGCGVGCAATVDCAFARPRCELSCGNVNRLRGFGALWSAVRAGFGAVVCTGRGVVRVTWTMRACVISS